MLVAVIRTATLRVYHVFVGVATTGGTVTGALRIWIVVAHVVHGTVAVAVTGGEVVAALFPLAVMTKLT